MNRDIRLQIEGSLLEKLIQRALEQGAVFARIERISPRRMIVDADLRSSNLLLALCKKYGYSCRTLRRGGRTLLLERLRRRWTLLPALLLGAVLCALFFSRVWMVDVAFTGESAHLGSRAEILACLEANGIRPGMMRTSIDTDLLQKQISAASGAYSHVGVKQQGIRLLVELSPENPEPQMYEIGSSRDLVALRSGVIEEIEIYSGQACIGVGDTVLRGDMLIRGEEKVGKDTQSGKDITSPVGALGKVRARCWFEGNAEGSLVSKLQKPTGRSSTACRLSLMGLSIPITQGESYFSEEIETERIPIVGMFIPLQIEKEIHHETTETTIENHRAQLEERLTHLARADALRKISAAVDEYRITSSWTDVTPNGNTLHIRAVYEISTDIAATRDALIEEVY